MGAFGVLLLPLTFLESMLGWEDASGADESGPFEAGATGEGMDFSCIGIAAGAPAPFGRALCFARSANARFILVLPKDQSKALNITLLATTIVLVFPCGKRDSSRFLSLGFFYSSCGVLPMALSTTCFSFNVHPQEATVLVKGSTI